MSAGRQVFGVRGGQVQEQLEGEREKRCPSWCTTLIMIMRTRTRTRRVRDQQQTSIPAGASPPGHGLFVLLPWSPSGSFSGISQRKRRRKAPLLNEPFLFLPRQPIPATSEFISMRLAP